MEIDEQSDGDVQQFHVAQQLRLVDWQDLFHGSWLPRARSPPLKDRIAKARPA